MMKTKPTLLLPGIAFSFLLLCSTLAGPAQRTLAGTTFPQTGYTIWGPFEQYWHAHGGLRQFGLPLSSVYSAGDGYDAQWFERALFTYTPSNPDPHKVQLQLLGAMLTGDRQEDVPFRPARSSGSGRYFSATGHNLSGKFLEYWEATGGLPIYGYPLSEEFMEKNPADGKVYRVQYFERNRFELHPENAGTPFEVQLGLLGVELLAAVGGSQAIAKLGQPMFYPRENTGAVEHPTAAELESVIADLNRRFEQPAPALDLVGRRDPKEKVDVLVVMKGVPLAELYKAVQDRYGPAAADREDYQIAYTRRLRAAQQPVVEAARPLAAHVGQLTAAANAVSVSHISREDAAGLAVLPGVHYVTIVGNAELDPGIPTPPPADKPVTTWRWPAASSAGAPAGPLSRLTTSYPATL